MLLAGTDRILELEAQNKRLMMALLGSGETASGELDSSVSVCALGIGKAMNADAGARGFP